MILINIDNTFLASKHINIDSIFLASKHFSASINYMTHMYITQTKHIHKSTSFEREFMIMCNLIMCLKKIYPVVFVVCRFEDLITGLNTVNDQVYCML